MRVTYKRIKVAMPHCGDCQEELQGNNSLLMPYKCRCGEWKSKSWDEPFEFVLKEKTILEEVVEEMNNTPREKFPERVHWEENKQ